MSVATVDQTDLTRVLIVGGGLSGLHSAFELSKRNVDFVLVEARERLGGRILSENANSPSYEASQPALDFGPSWFWPGQMRMERLIGELGLAKDVFLQHADGDSLYEDHQSMQRSVPGISMQGSYRLRGGMRQLITALASRIADHRVIQSTKLERLVLHEEGLRAEVVAAGERSNISCELAVLAMPPRLIVDSIELAPALSSARVAELRSIPTWMAGHAKLVATYEEPFWRSRGYSGDVISQRGPLAEIHDASAEVGEPYALFGFLGVAAAERLGNTALLKKAAVEQLSRLFGESAANPLDVSIKDWAADCYTATQLDQEVATAHTLTSISAITETDWAHRIVFSGSEAAAGQGHINGYLEGALAASESAIEIVMSVSQANPGI